MPDTFALQSLFDKLFIIMLHRTHEKFKADQDPSTLFDTTQSIAQMAVQLNKVFKTNEKTVFSPAKMELLQSAYDYQIFETQQLIRFTRDLDVVKDLYSKIHDFEEAFKKIKSLITLVE
jgi:hypothetical protein